LTAYTSRGHFYCGDIVVWVVGNPAMGDSTDRSTTAASGDVYTALVQTIVSGAVLFVGAGSSCKAGYPPWDGLLADLEAAARTVNEQKVVEACGIDGLLRASEYKKLLGATYYEILQRTFAPRSPAHNAEHETLVALPFRHVLTTNYDGVLESAHGNIHGAAPVSFDGDEWSKLTELRQRQTTHGTPRSYVHLHGSVARTEGIVLCQEEYDQRYHHETRFKDFLRDMLCQRLVFVGVSLTDEEFKYVLREAEARAHPSGARHFALLAQPDSDEKARIEAVNLRGKYGIDPVYFDNASKDFAGLWKLLGRLRTDVAAAAPAAVVPANAIKTFLDELLVDQPDQHRVAQQRIPELIRRFGLPVSPATVDGGGGSSLDQEIDGVFKLVGDGRPDEAITRYEEIRVRKGDELTPKHRYRLDANIGNALYAKGELREASKYYLRAVGQYRETKDARAIEILGHLLAGDRPTTRRLAADLCAQEPAFARSWSLWVRGHDDSADLSAVALAVPESVRSDAEVALALADLAGRTDKPDAQVAHARAAVVAEPDWADGLSMLGAAIVTAERRYATFDADRGVIPRDPARLQEAEKVITKAISVVSPHDPAGRLPGLRFNRSVIRRLLGQDTEARDDLREAFRLDPEESIIAVAFAMEAEAAADVDAAISALAKRVPDGEHDEHAKVATVSLLLRRKHDGDGDAALDILNEMCGRLGEVAPPVLRGDVVRLGLRARFELGRMGEGPAFVDELPAGSIPPYQRPLFKARACLQAGQREEAINIAGKAIQELGDQGHWIDRREAALLAQECGLHADAVRLWRSILPTGYTGSDTIHLAHAAFFANDWRSVLDVCAAVRTAGRTTRKHLQVEVEVLAASREPRRAIRLLQSWIAEHRDDKFATLHLSVLALRDGQPELVVFDQSRLPSIAEVTHATAGAAVVYVLRRGPKPDRALTAAYCLYRRFPDDHDANWAIVACVFDPSATPLAIDRPTKVGDNAAVLVGRDGEAPRWVYVEASPDPVASRGEFPASHEFVRSMWGRSAGDSFEYLGHSYKVTQVENCVLRRVHDIMEHYEENFPGQRMLRRFNAPAALPPGASIKEVLGEVYPVLEQHDYNRELLESMYREKRLPITTFAKWLGRPIFDVVRGLASDHSMGVRADDGRPDRWPEAIAAATASELILDETVLAGAMILGLLDDLPALGPKLVVPWAVLDEIRRLSLDAGSARPSRGTMGLYKGQFFHRDFSPEETAREVEHLDRVVTFIQAHCEVVGGEATLDLPADLHEKLGEVLDTASIDAVALAVKRGAPLWTDDLGLQQLLPEFDVRVSTVWTQAVIRAAHDSGRLSIDRLHQLQAALLDNGYSFTRLSANDAIGVLRSVKWRIDRGAGKALVQMACDVALMNRHNALIAASLLKKIWGQCPRRADAKHIVLSVIEGVGGGQRSKVFASWICHFRPVRRIVRVHSSPLAERAGVTDATSRPRDVPIAFDPFCDNTGRSLKRFLRAWRSRDGEFRPRAVRFRNSA
jgi:tetratricopeptide (TPR) repeat protein/NAD-dependent SIR2 family protein deacetylase